MLSGSPHFASHDLLWHPRFVYPLPPPTNPSRNAIQANAYKGAGEPEAALALLERSLVLSQVPAKAQFCCPPRYFRSMCAYVPNISCVSVRGSSCVCARARASTYAIVASATHPVSSPPFARLVHFNCHSSCRMVVTLSTHTSTTI